MHDGLYESSAIREMSRIRGRDTKPEPGAAQATSRPGSVTDYTVRIYRASRIWCLVRHKSRRVCTRLLRHRHHGCSIATTPKSNIDFWLEKFDRNVARDRRNIWALQALGWRVYVVWECELASVIKAKATADRLALSIIEPSPQSGIVGRTQRSRQRGLVQVG